MTCPCHLGARPSKAHSIPRQLESRSFRHPGVDRPQSEENRMRKTFLSLLASLLTIGALLLMACGAKPDARSEPARDVRPESTETAPVVEPSSGEAVGSEGNVPTGGEVGETEGGGGEEMTNEEGITEATGGSEDDRGAVH